MIRPRGFTLIEIGVALGVAALMLALAVPAFSAVTRAQLRGKSGELAGSIRAMFGYSAVTGRSCRLVFDLDAGAFWPECAKSAVRLGRDRERSRGGAREATPEEELAARLAEEQGRGRDLSDRDKVRAELAAKSAFSAAAVPDVARVKLGRGVRFADVWVQHQVERYTAGQAFLYFWPSGLTEAAGIRLAQGDDVFTLLVAPLTGKVRVVNGRVEAPGER